jgi:hypothetical protein
VTFVVRVSGSDSGVLRGTVERVRTGERHGFKNVDELTAIVTRLATNDPPIPGGTAGTGKAP